jgi:16S rRNA (uracil1498-N3)-methyltransferase
MPRFYVPARDVKDQQARISGGEFRHLQRVLRLREGDRLTLFDDDGNEHAGVIVSLSPRAAVVRITASTRPTRESALAITLYQGIPKGRKMDLVVEKATELGVKTIVPFLSAFSAAGTPGAAGKLERWRRIAVSAAKQSARTVVPELRDPVTFPEVVANDASALKLLLYEGADTRPITEIVAKRTLASAAIVIGPEGGFSHDEVLEAGARGFQLVDVGPRILRTETAAVVAVALVQARWGDLGG